MEMFPKLLARYSQNVENIFQETSEPFTLVPKFSASFGSIERSLEFRSLRTVKPVIRGPPIKVMLHGTSRNSVHTTFRACATFAARKVVPLQVFDGRSKTRNTLSQQKNAKSCDRAVCYTGQLSAQRLRKPQLSGRGHYY